ncbi:MAG: hypothetical protein HY721_00740 [Planctomycetes bacterium]|nr:hypothetical protein [Planctomycetota bacterium]
MGRACWIAWLAFVTACGPTLSGLGADEGLTRVLCDPDDPANRCPGPDCLCASDSIEIRFRDRAGATYEYARFEDAGQIEAVVVMQVESALVQGWAYGVAHDDGDLELLALTLDDTAAAIACRGGSFCPPGDARSIETCGDDPRCAAENRKPGGGWIMAVILSFTQPTVLPLGRQPIARATYGLRRDVGEGSTRLRFTDRLAKKGSPATDLNVTIDGRSRTWTLGTDGLIRKAAPGFASFRRGDSDGDGKLNVTDAVWAILAALGRLGRDVACEDALDASDDGRLDLSDAILVLQHLFSRGPAPPEPGLLCGPDPTVDGLSCAASGCS